MAEDGRSTRGWTRFFTRKDLVGEDVFGKFLAAVARIFEGGDEEETFRQLRAELVRAFDCDDVSLFIHDPTERAGASEGDWTLKVSAGFGEGNRVSQADARAAPELVPGAPVSHSERLAQVAALKAVALAFDEGVFYGADIERNKIVLLKNPAPEDDLGSGDLSVLAIPLFLNRKASRVTERVRVGVLALFKTPVRRELQELEASLRTLLAQAVVTPRVSLKDPVTGLFTEGFLREELARHLNMFSLTRGKLHGGFVVGTVDTLRLYKQTLESAGNVDPRDVTEKVSDVLRGVGGCLWRRCSDHALGPNEVYGCGVAGRIGNEAFGAILPLLHPNELKLWALRLQKEVILHPFAAEELLEAGDVTVSLRVIPFARGGVDELWGLAARALEAIYEQQLAARRDPQALRESINTLLVFQRGKWLTSGELDQALRI